MIFSQAVVRPWIIAMALVCNLLVGSGCGSSSQHDPEGVAKREDRWLRGDLHLHTQWSDGWDDAGTVVALAEFLGRDIHSSHVPAFRGNYLDFIAVTDHRTVDVRDDPEFASETLTLILGEEFGTNGHANCWGIHEHVDHDPGGDGVTLEDIQAGVEASHAQGGLFSINHPFLSSNPFPWDVREHDAIEIWNSGWALMSPTFTHAHLEEWESAHGEASPLFRKAVETQGQGASMQALELYEAMLSRGVHVALVGGSDRHIGLMPGFPTTWVRASSSGVEGIVEGIRRRRTFVSRTPASSQVLLEVTVEDTTWSMGDEIPIAEGGQDVTIEVTAGRAKGGRLLLIRGEHVPDDASLTDAPLGEAVLDEPISSHDFTMEIQLTVKNGTWLYPVVHDRLFAPGLTDDQRETVTALAQEAVSTSDEDFGRLGDMIISLVPDDEVIWEPELCDPSTWAPDRLQCVPIPTESITNYMFPDMLDRALNVLVEDDAITEWSMGAVGSAVVFKETTP
jgi:hypothetical protein